MTKKNNYRFESDHRQFGGMMMITGFCAIIQPIANIVSAFGPDGANTTDPSVIPFWGMIGAFCLFANGITSVLLGYTACVHDASHKVATGFLIALIQTAFIPYITDMTNLGKLARKPPEEAAGLIPLGYNATQTDVEFVGSCGVAAVFCYGFTFVGSMSFMTFCLHAYTTGDYKARAAPYFRGRLMFYSGMLVIGGAVQTALGSYIVQRFGVGPLQNGRIRAAMLVVNYPDVSIMVGVVQVVNGIWGILRSMGMHSGPGDFLYQIACAGQWIMVLCLQDVMQIAYMPGNTMAQMAAGIAAVSFGINMMPAYLDHKMRNTAEFLPHGYYDKVKGKGNEEPEEFDS